MDNTRKYTIRELREAHGWTRRQLSHLIDVAEGTIMYWEHNRTEPRIAQQKKLLAAFNVRWEEVDWPQIAKKSSAGTLNSAA